MTDSSESVSFDDVSSVDSNKQSKTPYLDFEDAHSELSQSSPPTYKNVSNIEQINIKKFLEKIPINKPPFENIKNEPDEKVKSSDDLSQKDCQQTFDQESLNPGHIFIVALIERICELYVSSTDVRSRLFICIIQELCRINILPDCIKEIHNFSSIRKSYIAHFSLLFNSAIDTIAKNMDVNDLLTDEKETEEKEGVLSPVNEPISNKLNEVKEGQLVKNRENIFYTRSQNDFENFKKIGSGAYGLVFSAQNRLDKQFYAIKFIPFSLYKIDCLSIDELYQEIAFLSKLNHPHLIRYYSSWVELVWSNADMEEIMYPTDGFYSNSHGASKIMDLDYESTSNQSLDSESYKKTLHHTLCIQTELCQLTLHDWLLYRNSRTNLITKNVAAVNLSICKQILSGVHYLHSNNVIHRDLKCTNIFISTNCFDGVDGYIDDELEISERLTKFNLKSLCFNFAVKIGDFGLAKEILKPNCTMTCTSTCNNTKEISSDSSDAESFVYGTELYAAPEQTISNKYDYKVDMYSLGIIFFELYHPFKTQSERYHVLKHVKSNPLQVKVKLSKKLEILADVITNLLSPNAKKRPDCTSLLDSSLFMSDTAQRIKSLEDQVAQLTEDLRVAKGG